MEVLTPPDGFGHIWKHIYRSNSPLPIHFPFIKTLKLRTIVILTPGNITKHLADFAHANAITLIQVGVVATAEEDWRPVGDEVVKKALEITLQPSHLPVLLLCNFGVHETGIVAGCLRRLQGWPMSAVLAEYRRFAGLSSRNIDEQTIELFDLDLVHIPQPSSLHSS